MATNSGHYVAVVGGACSGSEAAFRLAEHGYKVAVFEQQPLPFGKIEDGLPKWHVKLRNKEENKIREKLSHPNVEYVPNTKLGRDVQFDDLISNWGFSAVLLASGAWRDRPLPVEGIDDYVENGFYYQNPFVDWFNHKHEDGYDRFDYSAPDNAIVVGGGLASIDVVKILMLEAAVSQLRDKKGITSDILELEHKGISKFLEKHEVTFDELDIQGCTLYYRRRNIDMPLGPMPPNPTPEKMAKMQEVRQRILANAQRDYLFKFEACCRPTEKIVENGRLNGLVFIRTEIVDGRVKDVPGSEFEARSPLVISSIGSIPEPIAGIPTKGELFVISDVENGQMDDYEHIFALGNAVTGRGNIRESELHGRKVVTHVIESYLQNLPELSADEMADVESRIKSAQQQASYDGQFDQWIERHMPERLEEQLAEE